jgi:hypothetical protein
LLSQEWVLKMQLLLFHPYRGMWKRHKSLPLSPVYDARVVDEETASPIVEVMPMEELESPETATSQRDAPSKNRNRRIIVALAAVLALVVGVIACSCAGHTKRFQDNDKQ